MSDATVFTNARLLTPDPAPAGHDSIGLVDDRIVAIGSRAHVEAALPTERATVDLGGRVVAPGFIDAHLHPMPMCFFEHHVDLTAAGSLADVFDLLAERATRVGASSWVVGHGLDDEVLSERRLPSRVELDRVGGGRPTLILRRDGHHAVGSSAALDAAGIDATTPDPPGGVIHRSADGDLTGLCGERAAALLLSAVPLPAWDEFAEALDGAAARLARSGVTGISAMCQTNEVGPAGDAGSLEAVAWTMLLDHVPFDLQTILISSSSATVRELRDGPLHDPARRRRLDAVKLFFDGTLGGRTACMHRPYSDSPERGMLTLDPTAAYEQMVDAHLAGLQICIHAIGDRATSEAIGLFDRLLREHPVDDHRHRVEHASVLDASTIETMAARGIAAVVQPISLASEQRWLGSRLGEERIGSVYPFRDLVDAGVVVAGSSDAPVESCDVLAAMHAAVNRHGIAPEQALTPAEALRTYTSAGAFVRRVEHETGSLTAGHRADLVVLSDDPSQGASVKVLATIAGGQKLFWDPRLDGPASR